MENKLPRRAPGAVAPTSNLRRGSEPASPGRPQSTAAPLAPTPVGCAPHGPPTPGQPFEQAPSGQPPSDPGGGAQGKMAAAPGERDAAAPARPRPKRRRVAEASPAHEEAEQRATEEQEHGQDGANPPSRRHLAPACGLGGMVVELPEMPIAGAATVRVERAADGAAGTSDGLAAAASLPSVAQVGLYQDFSKFDSK